MSEAKFQIYKDVNGKYRFRLIAPNNKIVAVGEAYETKAGCVNGVNAVKEHADAVIEDVTTQKPTLIMEEPTIAPDGRDFTHSGRPAEYSGRNID